MLDQAKVDLAVLWKLFQHSESGGEAEPAREILNLFTTQISLRRIEIALHTLVDRREAENVYHPHYFDEGGLWQISREGIRTVEKALKLPNSFIARLALNGDQWLQTDDAQKAILSKNMRYDDPKSTTEVVEKGPPAEPADTTVHVSIAPIFNNSGAQVDGTQLSAKNAGWFGAWGGWFGAAVGLAGFLWILHEAKVF